MALTLAKLLDAVKFPKCRPLYLRILKMVLKNRRYYVKRWTNYLHG